MDDVTLQTLAKESESAKIDRQELEQKVEVLKRAQSICLRAGSALDTTSKQPVPHLSIVESTGSSISATVPVRSSPSPAFSPQENSLSSLQQMREGIFTVTRLSSASSPGTTAATVFTSPSFKGNAKEVNDQVSTTSGGGLANPFGTWNTSKVLTGSGAPSSKPGGSGLFGSDPPKPQSSHSIGLFGNLDITNAGGSKPSAFGSAAFAKPVKNDRFKSSSFIHE